MTEPARLTATEVDARFAALVAEHRGASGRSKRTADGTSRRAATDALLRKLVVVIVFCLGVACGAVWPGRPLAALLIGIPLILVGFALVGRWRRGGRDD